MNFETMTPSKQESEKRSRETQRVVIQEQPLHLDEYNTKLDDLMLETGKMIAESREKFKFFVAPSARLLEIQISRTELADVQGQLFQLQGKISGEAARYTGPRDEKYQELMKYGQEVSAEITKVSNALYNLQRIESGMAIDLDGNVLSMKTGQRIPPQFNFPKEVPAVKSSDMPAWAKGMPTPTPPKTTWGKLKSFFGY